MQRSESGRGERARGGRRGRTTEQERASCGWGEEKRGKAEPEGWRLGRGLLGRLARTAMKRELEIKLMTPIITLAH